MGLSPEILEIAERTLKRFRIGGSIIAMIPLVYAFVPLLVGGRASASVPFTTMSVTLILLILWMCHCAERFVKGIQPGPQITPTK